VNGRAFFPEFEVSVGAKKLKSGGGAGGKGSLWRLEILREVNGGADEAFLQLGLTQALDAKPGDDVTVDLGYEGALNRVFTGTVDRLSAGLATLEVHALGAQAALMRKRGDKAFVNQKAGEVFQALVSDAGAEAGRTEAGVPMSFYLADSAYSHWEHGLKLGLHSGNDVYADAEGKIVFAPISGDAPPLKLKFGVDLLQAACEDGDAPATAIAIPESPASSAGEETASWLAKDSLPHKGEAAATGSGGGTGAARYHPFLRTQEHAQASADCLLLRRQREVRNAEVEMLGRSDVELGDTVELEGLPAGGDGKYVVLALRHALGLGPHAGFRTYASLGAVP
jgi:phage protein D